jgi:hypothetical protein
MGPLNASEESENQRIRGSEDQRIKESKNRRIAEPRTRADCIYFPQDITVRWHQRCEIIGIRQGYFRKEDGWFAFHSRSFLRNTSDSRRTHFKDRTVFCHAGVVLHPSCTTQHDLRCQSE